MADAGPSNATATPSVRTTAGHHSFVDFLDRGIPTGWIVPQAVYANSQAGFQPRPSVEFIVNGERGIRLIDALHERYNGLDGSSDILVLGEGLKISVRICVRAYCPSMLPFN